MAQRLPTRTTQLDLGTHKKLLRVPGIFVLSEKALNLGSVSPPVLLTTKDPTSSTTEESVQTSKHPNVETHRVPPNKPPFENRFPSKAYDARNAQQTLKEP